MENSKKKIWSFLKDALNLEYKKFHIANRLPASPIPDKWQATNVARIIFPLEGHKKIMYAQDGNACLKTFLPGDVLIIPPNAWTSEYWDTPHRMLSFVFREKFTRLIYIDHVEGERPLTNGPDIFFHTDRSLPLDASHTLQAICHSDTNSPALCHLFKALLLQLLAELEHSEENTKNRSSFLWQCIQEQVEMMYQSTATRETISSKLHIAPSHLSRLVHKYTGRGINEYITKVRMERAKRLLEENALNIDQIAEAVGINYTSYFCQVFKKYYLCSPGAYRIKAQKANATI